MRFGTFSATAGAAGPFSPFSPSGIFTRNMESHPLASSQTYAKRLANQLSYSNPNYTYNGEAAPKFFGYGGTGWGESAVGFQTTANIEKFTPSVFVVPAGQPTEKVTLVNSAKEAQPAGYDNNLQASFNAVPMPTLSLVPAGVLTAGGTDKEICIIQGNQMWEMWKLEYVGGLGWTFEFGAYVGPGSMHGAASAIDEWNGIFTPGEGGQIFGARASGLALIGGLISLQDLLEVLKAGTVAGVSPIKHALGIAIPVTGKPLEGNHAAPATRNDTANNVPAEHEGKANPASPYVDEVPEGTWCTFPAASRPSEYGITKPLAAAIYEAIRVYGLFVNDGSGDGVFYIESPVSLGSPYCYAKANPFAGASAVSGAYKYANEIAPSWPGPAIPLTEPQSGTTSFLSKQPWQELQLLEPFSS
jgi:hypothetical protein